VAESNINRQIHAADATLGQAKVEAMRERIASPTTRQCRVAVVDDFVTADNAAAAARRRLRLRGRRHRRRAREGGDGRFWPASAGLPLVTCGAAGGQIDPTQIRVDDLARTLQDPLLGQGAPAVAPGPCGFPRDVRRRSLAWRPCISAEPLRYPAPPTLACDVAAGAAAAPGPAGLNCAGFGSVVTVTATMRGYVCGGPGAQRAGFGSGVGPMKSAGSTAAPFR
jgi:tRNA A37 threonylcarbamoyladenosine dehydratase